MEMKWNPIEDGNMKGVPRDEEVIFTVLDEDTGEVRTATGKIEEYFLKKRGRVFVGRPGYPVDSITLKAWMKLPEPFEPRKGGRLMIRATDCNENTLGTLLKTMRKERGLSQIEVSEKVGRDASDLCKHENNKQAISWYIFLDYAEAMGYTVDMTIREKED